MNPRRLVLGVAGVGLLSAALFAGGTVDSRIPTGDAIAVLGNDYVLVVLLGALALLAALGVLEHGSGVEQARMPDPERAVPAPTPGDELADAIAGRAIAVPFLGRRTRHDVRARLRESAIAAVRHDERCTEAAARARVDAGEWTDDPAAAAFLATGGDRPPVAARVRALATGDTWFASRARRAADAIASMDRIAPDEPPRTDGESTAAAVTRPPPVGESNDEGARQEAPG